MSIEGLLEASDGLGLAAKIRAGEVSATEVLAATLRLIEARNPKVNAVVALMADQAAAAIRAGLPDGPFTGVPFLLKDFAALAKGTVTTSGARFLATAPSPVDSALVERQRRAGLVILGKTNTPEMAIASTTEPRLFGPARNPYDLSRSTGGSSGGSAAAVAAGMVALAHATDGGGSIRIPAAACGLYGLKPSRGRNSMAPMLGESLAGAAVEHAVTRSVRDSAALLDATAGRVPGDPYTAPPPARPYLAEVGAPAGRLKVALSDTPPYPCAVAPEVKAALAEAGKLLEALGHHVDRAAPPVDAEALDRAFMVAMSVNIANVIALRAEGRAFGADDFEPATWAMIERGRSYSGIDYVRAVQAFHRIGRQVAPFFEEWDVLVTPTLATLPPRLGEIDAGMTDIDAFMARVFGFAPFTRLFNATGQPAASLPLCWSAEGLSVGIQIVARQGAEDLLFRLSAELEEAAPWSGRRPVL